MKPKPTKIQPGATHWNPYHGPEWYMKDYGRWMYFEPATGAWVKTPALTFNIIPVEELMAQPPEWNGEGLPPVGTVCRINHERLAYDNARITYMGKGVFCYEVSGTEYAGSTYDATFYPIKSERDKAIEAMSLAIRGLTYLTKDVNAIAAALFDAGYRKVEK